MNIPGIPTVKEEYYNALFTQLELHEGKKSFPYTDTAGKLTIGIGHNLTDRGLSDTIIYLQLLEDIREAEFQLDAQFPDWKKLSEGRQMALTDIMFNLGPTRFKNFRKFWAAMREEDYKMASAELLNSKWRQQVGKRAYTLAAMIEASYVKENQSRVISS